MTNLRNNIAIGDRQDVGIKTGRCGNIFAGFYSTTDVYKDKSR
jgi:hypothetical protein